MLINPIHTFMSYIKHHKKTITEKLKYCLNTPFPVNDMISVMMGSYYIFEDITATFTILETLVVQTKTDNTKPDRAGLNMPIL